MFLGNYARDSEGEPFGQLQQGGGARHPVPQTPEIVQFDCDETWASD